MKRDFFAPDVGPEFGGWNLLSAVSAALRLVVQIPAALYAVGV